MSSEQPRKPTILTLQDDVAKNRPDLLHTQLELEGYAQDLLKLGVDVHTNLLPSMVAIRQQESGDRGFFSWNTVEQFGGVVGIKGFKTLGSFQLNVYDIKRILCKEPEALHVVNTLLQTSPIEGLTKIDDPRSLTYQQLKSLTHHNLYAFYFLNHTLTRTARNLQSKAREWGGVYDPKDIAYTTHFAQNHTPQTMYSAIALQNILQLARSEPNPINLRDAVDENYQDSSFWNKVWRKDSGALTNVMDKSRIVLDGKYNEEFVRLLALLKQRKGIDIKIQTNADGAVTKVNGVALIDNEDTIDPDKGFDVTALKQLFDEYNYAFYPLLSSDFAEKNKNRVHDEYNYAFRQYVSNISPETRAKRFEGIAPDTALSQQVSSYRGVISYPQDQIQHGVQRDTVEQKATSGALDCIGWIKYLLLKRDAIPASYDYMSQHEIDTYSYLGGVNEYHHIFAEKLDPHSIHVVTPQTYQTNHYFQVISSLHEGDIVGFGQEFPQAQGGRQLTIQQPSQRKQSTQLDVSMSHGGVVTRVTANNVRVTMSSGEVGKGGEGVVELPLFGPDGYYEKACLSKLQTPGLRTYKPLVFFGKVDTARCETSLQERIDALGDRQVEMVDGVPVVQLDTYKVYHKAAGIDPVSKKRANYCSEIARVNQQKLLAGTAAKNKIKFTEAKQHIADIMNSGMDEGLYQYQQHRGGESVEPIAYKGLSGVDGDVITEATYDELVPLLDDSRQGYKGYAPLVWDMYVDTAKGHRFTIVYGTYHDETGYFVIDTLRGPAKKSGGGTGICGLRDYFTTPGFYMNDRENPYAKAFLRVTPVGIDMVPEYVPKPGIVPMMNMLDDFSEHTDDGGDEDNLTGLLDELDELDEQVLENRDAL
ncbi:MAG: hypothetical protein WC004_01660 [Candidatus Absconditabacterales bacterium]